MTGSLMLNVQSRRQTLGILSGGKKEEAVRALLQSAVEQGAVERQPIFTCADHGSHNKGREAFSLKKK